MKSNVNEMDVIEWRWSKKPNQTLQPIQTSSVCVRLFSAHFMHAHVPQSRLEISNKEVFAMVRSSRERCFRMQFQCVLNFPFVYFFFSHSSFRFVCSFASSFIHFCWRINNKAKVSACLCVYVRLLNHRKPKLISPATATVCLQKHHNGANELHQLCENWLVRPSSFLISLTRIAPDGKLLSQCVNWPDGRHTHNLYCARRNADRSANWDLHFWIVRCRLCT